ncbi:MAG TPA: nitrogenase iron-molybdenum cofactor biosynthesis protein NifN, partial [Campylobacterales bacterium]|nr:nitrogenase iron-molybdenum cofactor biosynthesis protein NifN [Campylobacterales bacterium]
YVHTPDFEGGLESGFAKAIEATIEQLVEPTTVIDKQKALIIPHVSLTPIEIEILKEELEGFGFTPYALPDLSESLDGHLGLKQGAVSSGGIEVSDIEALGESAVVLTIGDSVKKCGLKMLEKNENTTHLHFNTIAGLKKGDAFYKALLDFSPLSRPTSSVIRWRKRLQDALLDTHFAIGGAKVVIACEPDQLLSIATTINEAGATIKAVVSPTKSVALENLPAQNIVIGDFEDVEEYLDDTDVLISNFHGERIAHKHHNALMLRGFPNYEEIGNQLKNDQLYRGSTYMLFELANLINHHKYGH